MSKDRKIIIAERGGIVTVREAPQGPIGLEHLQKLVGGYIEVVPTKLDDDIVMVVDEEGKLKGKEYNRVATEASSFGAFDPIVGSGVILQEVFGELMGVEADRTAEIIKRLDRLYTEEGAKLESAILFRPVEDPRLAKEVQVAVDITTGKSMAFVMRLGAAAEQHLIEAARSADEEMIKNKPDGYIVLDLDVAPNAFTTSNVFDTLDEAKLWVSKNFPKTKERSWLK